MGSYLGTKTFSVDEIEMLEEIQPRKRINEEVVTDYETVYRADASKMPIVRVFMVGKRKLLTRGFHRLTAMKRAGVEKLSAEVYQGTLHEAQLDAMADNREHGLRYSRDDKRVIVLRIILDEKYENLSIAEIAKMTGFSRAFVSGMVRSKERTDLAEEAEYDEVDDEVEEVESYEGEEVLEDLGAEERMKAQSKDIETACRDIQNAWRRKIKPLADKNPWVRDHGRLTTATQTMNTALETIRSCKGEAVCPKCDGEGCKVCRHTGYCDRSTYESVNF